MINSRKIADEINVFSNFFDENWKCYNPYFFVIFVNCIVIQCVLVELGGNAVKTYPLNMSQNLICIGIGASELLWGLILKFMPLKWFQCIDLSAEIPDESEEEDDGKKKKSMA